jgi:threonine synthase
MDIQISSNFERVLFDIVGRDSDRLNALMKTFKETGSFSVSPLELEKFRAEFMAFRCSDDDTLKTIAKTFRDHNVTIDPHTAVGLNALEQSGLIHTQPCVTLACAHPAKFPDVVKQATGITPELPNHLADIMSRPEKYQVMRNDFTLLKNHLLNI